MRLPKKIETASIRCKFTLGDSITCAAEAEDANNPAGIVRFFVYVDGIELHRWSVPGYCLTSVTSGGLRQEFAAFVRVRKTDIEKWLNG